MPDAAKAEAGDPALRASTVVNLTHLVADIAALGKPGRPAKTRAQDG
jgi:hypothetical protein